MSVIDQLACAKGRRDEVPNQELARALVENDDLAGLREVAQNLWNRDPDVQSDCIKVLYEVAYLRPDLTAIYAADFLKLLHGRSNRLVWGGMIALAACATEAAETLYPRWREIAQAMEDGSVITRDAGVLALARLAATAPERQDEILPTLFGHLQACRPKDVPQHAEKILAAIDSGHRAAFIAILEKRLEDLQGAQVTRVEKVIRTAGKDRANRPDPSA